MSFIVSFTPPPPGQTREAQHRRRVRQRGALVTGTVLLVGALAALPLPVWNAGQQLDLRASELRGWTEDARRDEREAQAFRASDGEAESARGAAEIARWLVARDRIDTTKELLALARATGLRVVRIDVQADSELLSTAAAAPQGTAVLGVLQAGAPMAAAGAGADGTGADGAGAGTGANGAGVQGAEAGAAR
ncbi:MAG TPA: hypothetical protein VK824_05765, partial [Planctomycetota bacterium]|nr:hypothetical protein [Planctomycetota bacterium]